MWLANNEPVDFVKTMQPFPLCPLCPLSPAFVSCMHPTVLWLYCFLWQTLPPPHSKRLAATEVKLVFKGEFNGLWSILVHLLVRTAVIFHKADLSVVVPDKVLQREEAPAVCPHRDFTGQSQSFGGRLQQGHLVPVTVNRGDSAKCGALIKLLEDKETRIFLSVWTS